MNQKKEKNIKRGKQSRAKGLRFENAVRKDLESNDWIVDKWNNNLEYPKENINKPTEEREDYKLIPAKRKWAGPNRPMMLGSGFPDFLCFKQILGIPTGYIIQGVESKMNGILTKIEKEKCKWYLKNNIFSKILIASKGEKRGEIIYKGFKMEKKK